MAKIIKDLKDLRVLRRRAGYRHSGPTDLKRTRDVFSVARTMARDRPSLYGERMAFFIVARGPVPRDHHHHDVCFPSVVCDRLITNRSGAGAPYLQSLARERWRGTGPRPTGRESVFFTAARDMSPQRCESYETPSLK